MKRESKNAFYDQLDNDEENQQIAVKTPTASSLPNADQESAFLIINNDVYKQLKRDLLMETTAKVDEAAKIALELKKEITITRSEVAEVKEDLNEMKISMAPENNNSVLYRAHDQRSEEHSEHGFHNSSNNKGQDLETTNQLSADTYTLMMIKAPFTKSWWLGLMTFTIQIVLLLLIFSDQLSTSKDSTIFDVPFQVTGPVRTGQFLAIFISIVISYDILMPIKDLNLLWYTKDEWWSKIVYGSIRNQQDLPPTGINRWRLWMVHIVFPSFIKFIQGVFVLIITFVITIKSDDVIDLFKDFAAMQVISELDNAVFHLSNHGYFGTALEKDTKTAKSIKVRDKMQKICFGLPLRLVILIGLSIVMITTFINGVVIGQVDGTFFQKKYPNCMIRNTTQIASMGDGKCNGGLTNTFQCGFDGGDCLDFNIAFPKCMAIRAYEVGDGICQQDHNYETCGFDGGDCCSQNVKKEYLGDSQCNGGLYSTKMCGFDGGDCDVFRSEYPLCTDADLPEEKMYRDDGTPIVIGDGICDFIPQYMTEECGYEHGDCKKCRVKDPSKLGDGICDGGEYNTEACGFDNGDCTDCNEIVGDSSHLGNGICDGGKYMSPVCDNDAGDCDGCLVANPLLIGDGICNGGAYNTEACGFDGGDCIECNNIVGSDNITLIGDGFCDKGVFNSEACGFDGGDCS